MKKSSLQPLEQIVHEISKFITEEILSGESSDLEISTPLLEIGVLDSLSLVTLVSFIETKFGICIPENSMIPDNFETIESIASLIYELQIYK